jgi:hypothetical protein
MKKRERVDEEAEKVGRRGEVCSLSVSSLGIQGVTLFLGIIQAGQGLDVEVREIW